MNWHPLQTPDRVENYALSTERPTGGPLRYLMACGHRSVPGHAFCERGCQEAPLYRQPYVFHREWGGIARFVERHRLLEAGPLTPERWAAKLESRQVA